MFARVCMDTQLSGSVELEKVAAAASKKVVAATKKLPAAQKRLAAAQANLDKVQAHITATAAAETSANQAVADHAARQATLTKLQADATSGTLTTCPPKLSKESCCKGSLNTSAVPVKSLPSLTTRC